MEVHWSAAVRVHWREYAERYLQQWCDLDRGLVRAFSVTSVTCQMLRELCSPRTYQVARTVPGNGVGKYQVFAGMLNRYRGTVMTRKNVPEIIDRELLNMRRSYGKGFLSAITKAFWMIKKHPVVIYDSFAWTALRLRGYKPGYDGYSTYFHSWFRFYDDLETQKGLDDALSVLAASVTAKSLVKSGKISSSEINDLLKTDWLRNRVVDIRLWYEGEAAKRDAECR